MYYISDLQSDLVSLIPIVAILRQECRLVYSIYFLTYQRRETSPLDYRDLAPNATEDPPID